jgi:hypothetical protein
MKTKPKTKQPYENRRRQTMSLDAASALLQQALGFEDVEAVVSTLLALPPDDVRPYVGAMLGHDAAAADAIVAAIARARSGGGTAAAFPAGAGAEAGPARGDAIAYRKGVDDDDPSAAGRPRSGPGSRAAPPVVGGASAVAATRRSAAPNKRERQAIKSRSAGADALLPGRILCRCNARRHGLLWNCLGCGLVICEQQVRLLFSKGA